MKKTTKKKPASTHRATKAAAGSTRWANRHCLAEREERGRCLACQGKRRKVAAPLSPVWHRDRAGTSLLGLCVLAASRTPSICWSPTAGRCGTGGREVSLAAQRFLTWFLYLKYSLPC